MLGAGAIVASCGSGGSDEGSTPTSGPRTSAAPTGPKDLVAADGAALALAPGFRVVELDRFGSTLADGSPTPAFFDGMACVAGAGASVVLFRNHEVRGRAGSPGAFASADGGWDPAAGAGVTVLEVELGDEPRLVSSRVGLRGTLANCAGGQTPAGTWLTCEESVDGVAEGFGADHGYVYEVSPDPVVAAQPLRAMGRFLHEAAAFDPTTGLWYLTEDNGYDSGLYRFTPTDPERLAAGGTLEMLAVVDRPEIDLAYGHRAGDTFEVNWVPIADPDPAGVGAENTSVVFNQGFAAGGARFRRLEGACWNGAAICISETEGGEQTIGQVWTLDPAASELTLVATSDSADDLDMPDNVAAAPGESGAGSVVICEDGADRQYLRILRPDGTLSTVGANTADNTELAGACFSPDGSVLFVNVYGSSPDPSATPARTLAVLGPWSDVLV